MLFKNILQTFVDFDGRHESQKHEALVRHFVWKYSYILAHKEINLDLQGVARSFCIIFLQLQEVSDPKIIEGMKQKAYSFLIH